MSQNLSNELNSSEDLPLVALLTEPFHDKNEEEQDALIERMRALRNNAAKARSETKKTSNKIKGIKTKKDKSFSTADLFGGQS
tara:strand:+ start:142 stop:390 length:249 start_codon:yes stop_codon:yes gene_type:complete